MMTELAIDCKNVTKIYKTGSSEVIALNHTGFKANQGELILLAGPSGCGKTTLISVIAGILNYNEGSCFVLGQNLQDMTETDRLYFRSQHIGFVFQQFNLI